MYSETDQYLLKEAYGLELPEGKWYKTILGGIDKAVAGRVNALAELDPSMRKLPFTVKHPFWTDAIGAALGGLAGGAAGYGLGKAYEKKKGISGEYPKINSLSDLRDKTRFRNILSTVKGLPTSALSAVGGSAAGAMGTLIALRLSRQSQATEAARKFKGADKERIKKIIQKAPEGYAHGIKSIVFTAPYDVGYAEQLGNLANPKIYSEPSKAEDISGVTDVLKMVGGPAAQLPLQALLAYQASGKIQDLKERHKVR